MNAPLFPRMALLQQRFPETKPLRVAEVARAEVERLRPLLRPGMRIAVGVGSRGISNLSTLVHETIRVLQSAGARPFIIPAMGSHGGATPEGQRELLAEYGVTEAAMGAPIEGAMETEVIGRTADGVDVRVSCAAAKADGIVVINRIKPHTDFYSTTIGSGIRKMLVIGLGKREGAAAFHIASSRFGYENVLRTVSDVILAKLPVLGGLAVVENHQHQTARIACLLREEIPARETELFTESSRLMPRLPFDDIDLLIIDRIGKNISGAGMDPNITGRSVHGYISLLGERSSRPVVRRLFVRDITPETHGNAIGIGLADFTTTRLVQAMDARVTSINAMTSLTVHTAKVPIHFATDREALARALETLALNNPAGAKIIRIQDTLSLESCEVSEAFANELRGRNDLLLSADWKPMQFGSDDNLLPLGA